MVKVNNITRDELIQLGKRIVGCEGTEEEINNMIDIFDNHVPHPNGSNLFFYPEDYNSRKSDISKYNPTVEEVVDICLSYNSKIIAVFLLYFQI